MKLTEQQLIQLIRESAMKVINEIGYHEKQKREQSDEEHAEWIKKKSEAKKRELERQRKEKGDEKSDSKSIDYYDYKHGKGNFPVMKEDKENTVRLSESQLREVIKGSVAKVLKEHFDFDDLPDFEDVPDADSLEDDELVKTLLDWAKEIQADENYAAANRWLALYSKIADKVDEGSPIFRAYHYIKSMAKFGPYGAHRMTWPGLSIDRSNKNAVGLNETTLDYDMDNFSGRWSRGPRYDILVDGEVYYSDVPDESVDRLYADLERRGYENIQVQEL